jgi:hypothetical protein
MSFLETYENILLTLIAISTTGLFIIRFLEWNTRPRDMSAEQVATLLRKFIEDTATQGEWDYFATGPRLADPELEAIRIEAGELFGPRVEPETTKRLQELLVRTEALIHS